MKQSEVVEKSPAKKKTPAKRMLLNCQAANHATPLMQEVIKATPGWQETLCKENFDMMYLWHNTDPALIYDILLNKKNKIINRYPEVVKIARKDNLESMMRIAYDECDSFDFMPRTFIFPQDEASFHAYQDKHKSAVFIAKPGAGSMGDSISLF